MASDLFPCPNPKCGYWNPVGRTTCIRCKRDLGQALAVATKEGLGGHRSLYGLAALTVVLVLLMLLWWQWESKWSDKQPPNIIVSSPIETTVVVPGQILEIKGTLQDNNPHHVQSGSVTAEVHDGAFLIQAPVPKDGGEVSIVGYDKAGNVSAPVKFTVTIDAVAPEVAGLTPADGAVAFLAATAVTGAATENISTATVNGVPISVDGATFSGTVTLKPGPNVLKVAVKDKAGNVGEKTVNVTLQERQLPENLTPLARTAQGTDTFKSSKDGSVLVLVPGGAFTMGADDSDSDEKPAHQVSVSDFFIDQTPITNAQYAKFCEATNRELPPAPDFDENYMAGSADSPVVDITWQDAHDYAQWAGRRLVTEAEWEKAARGTTASKFPWGNEGPMADVARANVKGNADGFENTSPVGKYPDGASPYGVLDMAGNVWQWCADFYDEKYYRSSPEKDPTGPASGKERVLRGGAYTSDPNDVRSTNRYKKPAEATEDNVGFRTGVSFP